MKTKLCLLAVLLMSQLFSWGAGPMPDPYLGSVTIPSGPGVLVGQQVNLSFIGGNASTGTKITYKSGGEAIISITLIKTRPVLDGTGNPTGITGEFAPYFDWTATEDLSSGTSKWTMLGIQNKTIPADFLGKDVVIPVVITQSSTQADANNKNGHGATVQITESIDKDSDPNNDFVSVYGYTDIVMPVTFQSYDAKIVGNKLVVNWTTASETNNDFFNIQVMGSDSSFKTVGRISSKAENGTSSTSLEYSFEKELGAGGSISFMGLALFAAGFILLLFNRRNKLLYTFLLVSGLSMSTVSCRKNTQDREANPVGKQMVRVVQVDKDGVQAYSKIAVAVRQ
ncbi:hypothetical protein [Niabella hirudinis]|uniref:hypothetical protein n=1 Tax=Niabella hirudinis TaxID=1285929 RepID=UPI003EBA029B